jgi:H+-translocating NAD(P) transhydrogenase subunit beta
MSIDLIANLAYIVSAILFIYGLKMLGSPATARKGNLLSALGMLIAVVAGLSDQGIVSYQWIIIGLVLGAIIGGAAARLVEMTSMPEMVALFNGSGGAASLLVGMAPQPLIRPLIRQPLLVSQHPSRLLPAVPLQPTQCRPSLL